MNIFERIESNVRSYSRSFPVVFTKAKMSKMYDENGNEYIDFFDGAGALNYGHNNDFIKSRIIEYIESEFHVTITEEMLRQAAVKRNALRKAKAELMELQKTKPVSGVVLHAFLEKLDTYTCIDEAIAEIHKFIAEAESAVSPNAKRILVTGCPMGGIVNKVVGAVERNGGYVVCFETCTGVKAARCLVDTEREDIVAAIADAYLDVGCAVMAPNVCRMKNLPELIEEFKAEGVIDVTLQACTCYSIETRAIRKLCEEHNIPCMSLETDFSQTDSGQIETRIAAFVEML